MLSGPKVEQPENLLSFFNLLSPTVKMKLSLISILSLAFIATATPSGADYSLVGFAKDNPIGPTTGGAGKKSKTVTVSSVDALVSAVAGTEPKIIYAKGNFNLTSRLRPGSNKVC